jgi:hypothetical protein
VCILQLTAQVRGYSVYITVDNYREHGAQYTVESRHYMAYSLQFIVHSIQYTVPYTVSTQYTELRSK